MTHSQFARAEGEATEGSVSARPDSDLLLAHRGTAYLLRWLSLLAEDDYDSPAEDRAAQSRRRIIASIGYEARGFARLAEETRPGQAARTFDSQDDMDEEIDLGATLPARALRFLVEHSAVHLSVEWRDLPDALWGAVGCDARGALITPAETVWMRAKSVWLSAIDLGNGASFADLPRDMLLRLAEERVGDPSSSHGAMALSLTDDGAVVAGAAARASGRLQDVVRWLYDRGDRNLRILQR